MTNIRAITVPWDKLLLAPSRRVKVTVPDVVGFQVMVEGWPAVSMYPPEGMLNGFALEFCAMTPATKSVRLVRIVNRIVIGLIGHSFY